MQEIVIPPPILMKFNTRVIIRGKYLVSVALLCKSPQHVVHFARLFSAVSTTTVAENIPQEDPANGNVGCLGVRTTGVTGADSQ